MRTEARFPGVGEGAGHYESFYIKATRPGGGRGVWIRHTIHKRPGEGLTGSIWFTLFDADAPGPRATKVTVPAAEVSAPGGAYIEVGEALLEPGAARGAASHARPRRELGPQLHRPRPSRSVTFPTSSSTAPPFRGRSCSRPIPTRCTRAS